MHNLNSETNLYNQQQIPFSQQQSSINQQQCQVVQQKNLTNQQQQLINHGKVLANQQQQPVNQWGTVANQQQQPINGLLLSKYWLIVGQIRTERLHEGRIKQSTWRKEYAAPYNHLFDWLLSHKKLHNLIDTTNTYVLLADVVEYLRQIPSNSRKRKRYFVAIRLLWTTATLPTTGFDNYNRPIDLNKYGGTYSLEAINPRTLPTDPTIVQYANHVKQHKPEWHPVYCYLATYGLRNTELLTITYDYHPNLFVSDSKTKQQRYVLPFHKEWPILFDLKPPIQLPPIKRKDSHSFSHAVTTLFRKLDIPFRPKDLRHCYARRMAELNYPTIYAAKLMGHSVAVHESTYLHFVGLDSYLQARPLN